MFQSLLLSAGSVTIWAILALLAGGCDRQPPVQNEAVQSQQVETVSQLAQLDVAGLEQIIEQTAADGRILVIDFWATWCVPCVAMFPELHQRISGLGDDVRLISVTLDSPGEYEQRAIAFLQQQQALKDAYLLKPDQQVAAVEALGQRWQDVVVPAILVYDQQGQLQGEFVDELARIEAIMARVEELLQSPEGAAES